MHAPLYSNCKTDDVTEMPRCFSISIQSDTAARAPFLPLDDARLLDGAAVQQQLFRQGRFAGVRVRNDRKRAPAVDLTA